MGGFLLPIHHFQTETPETKSISFMDKGATGLGTMVLDEDLLGSATGWNVVQQQFNESCTQISERGLRSIMH